MEYVPEDDGVDPPMPELPKEQAHGKADGEAAEVDTNAAVDGEAAAAGDADGV